MGPRIGKRAKAEDKDRSSREKTFCSPPQICTHSALSPDQLSLLQRLQVVAEIPDPLLHRPFVLLVVISEDRTPRRHVRRTVSCGTRSKFEDARHVFSRKFPAVT